MSEFSRKRLLDSVTRAVVKVGSGVLTAKDGLNRKVIGNLANDICALKANGIEIILFGMCLGNYPIYRIKLLCLILTSGID